MDNNFSFLNWIAFILLVYVIFIGMLFEGIDITFIGVGFIIALLLGQITIFFKAKKPQLKHAPMVYNIHTRDAIGQERYKQNDKQYRVRYQREIFVFYSVYLFPIIFSVLSLFLIFDFSIGISFFISAVVSTICMVVLIKIFNIGID